MSSIIAELESAEAIGEHSWRLEDGTMVREILGVAVEVAHQRLEELKQLATLDELIVPQQLVHEQNRLFAKRPWVEGSPLQPSIDLETAERILVLMASLPASLVLYDLRPEHILSTPSGLRLIDPGFSVAGTPPYASPEQYGRGEITPAIGYYQLGATLLHLMSGSAPQDAMTLLIPRIEPPLISQLPSSLAKRFRQLLEAQGSNRPTPQQLLGEFQAWSAFRSEVGGNEEKQEKAEHDSTVWDEKNEDSELIGDTLTNLVRSKATTLGADMSAGVSSWWHRNHLALTMFGIPILVSATLGVILWAEGENIADKLGVDLPWKEPKVVETVSRFPADKALPRTWTSDTDGAQMILIPAGPFYEGPDPEAGVGAEPIMTTLPAFYIDRYEVTNRQFKKFVDATGYQSEGCWRKYATANRMDHPVICVSWHDAQAYAKWAGKRLPTAEEWEKAARGGDARRFPWGNNWDPNRLNCFDSNRGNTAPVGSYPKGASPYGVEDMAGNVWEWVDSWYIPSDSDGSLPMLRQIRGGSRSDKAELCLVVAKRGIFPENGRLVNSGFRCVVDPQHPDAMGEGQYVELRSLPEGTGYERSHLPEAVAKPEAKPKKATKNTKPARDRGTYDANGDYYPPQDLGTYRNDDGSYNEGSYDSYSSGGGGGYSSGSSYSAGSYSSGGYSSGSTVSEGSYDPGFGEAPARSGAGELPPPAPQTTMNMSSQYVDSDDKELTGDF